MARASLRRFDVQAKWSCVLSMVSAVTCLALFLLLCRNWRPDTHDIFFMNPVFKFAVVGCAGLTMLLSFFGAALGFNSAGQRRNERQKLSWAGFFVGAGVLALAIVLFAAFYLLRLEVQAG